MRRLARLATQSLVVAGISLAPLLAAPHAQAAFVGKNGFIAFAGDRHTGRSDIWVVNPSGSGAKDLTAGNGLQDRSPSVSPEGGPHIAWVAGRTGCSGGCPGDIWIMDSRGGHVFNATRSPTQDEESPTWAPSGGVVAYSRAPSSGGSADIWTMVWTGTHFQRLTTSGADDIEPAFSPIDRLIAFASDRSGPYGIYSMDPSGNNVSLLAANAKSPNWHPQG